MKKYKVLAAFVDKFTKKYHAEGTIYETDNEERAEELQNKGFLGEEVQENPEQHEQPQQSKEVQEVPEQHEQPQQSEKDAKEKKSTRRNSRQR
jgi:hypothetical protein